MKILFLTAYFPPEYVASQYLGQNRNQAFADAGFDMVLYTPIPTRGITSEVRAEYKRNHRKELMFDGHMTVHRFSLMKEGRNSLQRALRYTLSSIIQFLKGTFSQEARECDVMFITSTPPIQGAMAALIKKIRHIPIVYNLHDIFPDSLVGTGLAKRGGLLWKIGRVIENFTYRNADKIIVISEDFKRNIMAKGVPEEKIVVVYNWVDEEAVKHVPREENVLFERYGLDRSKFYITYCGNIGLTQNMDMLLEVAKELESERDIHFVLIGEGAYKVKVQEIIKEKQIKNVTLLPFQPYEDISHVFSLGDVGLVISKPGVGENSVPSKTWSILSASRPVLANFDENELKEIVDKHKCGLFTKAGDKAAFKKAILDLYRNGAQCREMGENGRRFILENLTRAVGTQKYVDVIKMFEKGDKNDNFV